MSTGKDVKARRYSASTYTRITTKIERAGLLLVSASESDVYVRDPGEPEESVRLGTLHEVLFMSRDRIRSEYAMESDAQAINDEEEALP